MCTALFLCGLKQEIRYGHYSKGAGSLLGEIHSNKQINKETKNQENKTLTNLRFNKISVESEEEKAISYCHGRFIFYLSLGG